MKIVWKAIEYLTSALMITIVIIYSIQVGGRHIFGASPIWSDELSGYLLVWVTFMASVLCLKDDMHIKVDVFVNRFSPFAKRWCGVIISFLMLVILAVLTVKGYELSERTWNQFATSFKLSRGLAYSVVWVSAILMAVAIIENAVKALYGANASILKKTGAKEGDGSAGRKTI
jgi:TRAP-type C4-dicarboxylate transport system permease small subunit